MSLPLLTAIIQANLGCYGCGYAGCPHDHAMLHANNIGEQSRFGMDGRSNVDGRSDMFAYHNEIEAPTPLQIVVDLPANQVQFHAHGLNENTLTQGHFIDYGRTNRSDPLDGYQTSMALLGAQNAGLDILKKSEGFTLPTSEIKIPSLLGGTETLDLSKFYNKPWA